MIRDSCYVIRKHSNCYRGIIPDFVRFVIFGGRVRILLWFIGVMTLEQVLTGAMHALLLFSDLSIEQMCRINIRFMLQSCVPNVEFWLIWLLCRKIGADSNC